MPEAPVTLSIEQIEALYRLLSDTRHDINNDLSKIVGSSELIKLELMKLSAADPSRPPLKAMDRLPALIDAPKRISNLLENLSHSLEQTLGITRL